MDVVTSSKKSIILKSMAWVLTCNKTIKSWEKKQPVNLPFGVLKEEKVRDRAKQ